LTPLPQELGLCTDLYEIRMCESYLRLGMTESATFSLFCRPSLERPFYVTAGLDSALDVLSEFRFDAEALAYLRTQGISQDLVAWLRDITVTGELWAVPDGTVLLAHEPWLEFTAPLPIAQLLETALMNAVHAGTAVATKAARLVRAAEGRPVVEFGFRRAHGLETAIRASLAAYVGGCASTSNVAAGQRYGVPVSGTMAHSFVQAFDEEIGAFREFIRDHPGGTLLIDSYDTLTGVDRAIAIAKSGGALGAVRIDSEPLIELSREVRHRLDEAGLLGVMIFASGGLDEEDLAAVIAAKAPIDAFGVGSALVCSSDKPALDVAYKLVEYGGRGRAKYSRCKASLPGRKQIFRTGSLERDVLELRDAASEGVPLLELAYRDGERRYHFDRELARRRARRVVEGLPDSWFSPMGLDHVPVPIIGPRLAAEARAVEERVLGRPA
jgi:nicotinate phosphoribosyltransferase